MTTTATKRTALAIAASITLGTSGLIGYSVLDQAYASTPAPSVRFDDSAKLDASTIRDLRIPRPHFEEDDAQWNCLLDGDHHCAHVPACWTEHKSGPSDDEYPDERICGYADHAPAGSDGFVFGDFTHNPVIR